MSIYKILKELRRKPRYERIALLAQYARKEPKRSQRRKELLQALSSEVVSQLKSEIRITSPTTPPPDHLTVTPA